MLPNTFDLNQAIIGLKKTSFGLLFEWPLKTCTVVQTNAFWAYSEMFVFCDI